MKDFNYYLEKSHDLEKVKETGVSEYGQKALAKKANILVLEIPEGVKVDSMVSGFGFGISGDMPDSSKIKLSAYNKTGEKIIDSISFSNFSPDMMADFDGEQGILIMKQGSKEIEFKIPFSAFSYSKEAPKGMKKRKRPLEIENQEEED